MASPPPPPPQARHLCLLDLHPVVLREIMQYLLPPKTIEFVSAPNGPLGQTSYRIDDHTLDRETYMTTSNHFNAPQCQQVFGDEYERNDFATSFLRVSRECYNLGAPHLYAREFSFPSSTETSLAFLHDHGRRVHLGIRLHLKYGDRTIPETWRALFNVLIHERYIRAVRVTIGEEFWHLAPWRSGVHAVGNWKGWGVTLGNKGKTRSFLDHLARLAMRARYGEGFVHVSGWKGCEFSLEILNFSGRLDRKAFSEALDSAVYDKSVATRRSQVPIIEKYGYCDETHLEYSCHWDMLACRCRGDYWSPYRRAWVKGDGNGVFLEAWQASCD